VNVEDRTNPTYTDHQVLESRTNGLYMYEDKLFVYMHKLGLFYYSLEDPEHPERMGFYNTPGWVENIVVEDNLIYVADYFNFSIYSIGDSLVNDADMIEPSFPPFELTISAHPNPFNAETLIRYSLPVHSDVSLAIFDIYGRRVKTLIDAPQEAGYHNAIWDGRNEMGIPVSSGLYFCRINAGNFTKVRKMTLVK
jgi:hypothetical protein